jgi:hypothetical protein
MALVTSVVANVTLAIGCSCRVCFYIANCCAQHKCCCPECFPQTTVEEEVATEARETEQLYIQQRYAHLPSAPYFPNFNLKVYDLLRCVTCCLRGSARRPLFLRDVVRHIENSANVVGLIMTRRGVAVNVFKKVVLFITAFMIGLALTFIYQFVVVYSSAIPCYETRSCWDSVCSVGKNRGPFTCLRCTDVAAGDACGLRNATVGSGALEGFPSDYYQVTWGSTVPSSFYINAYSTGTVLGCTQCLCTADLARQRMLCRFCTAASSQSLGPVAITEQPACLDGCDAGLSDTPLALRIAAKVAIFVLALFLERPLVAGLQWIAVSAKGWTCRNLFGTGFIVAIAVLVCDLCLSLIRASCLPRHVQIEVIASSFFSQLLFEPVTR